MRLNLILLGIVCALITLPITFSDQTGLKNPIWFFLTLAAFFIPFAITAAQRRISNHFRLRQIAAQNWPENIKTAARAKRVLVGMTPAQVRLSWGAPTATEKREITAQGERICWRYGFLPRRNSRLRYPPPDRIWFQNGLVSKIDIREN